MLRSIGPVPFADPHPRLETCNPTPYACQAGAPKPKCFKHEPHLAPTAARLLNLAPQERGSKLA